jgi:hypothetical protein
MDLQMVKSDAQDSPQRGPRVRDSRGKDNQEWREMAKHWREFAQDDLED